MTKRVRVGPGRLARLAGAALARPFQFVLYGLSGFMPRREDLWVFGCWGGRRFADNSGAFFRYCNEHLDDRTRLVWISRERKIVDAVRSEGFEAHLWVSPRGAWCCARAGLHLFDCFAKDINYWLSRRARMVNLWSGVPLKTFERDIDNPRSRYHRLFHGTRPERWVLGMMMPWHIRRPDLIIATSDETAEITRRAFDVSDAEVVVTGFPRNDSLFPGPAADAARRRCAPAVLDAAAHGPVFLYLPTFRDSNKPFLEIDWPRVEDLMQELGGVFFLKFHPVDATEFRHESPRVVQLHQDTDVYDVLPHTTALISDYSSVIFDYLLLDRPVVTFTPDLEEFVKSSRSLLFHPRDIAAGPVCLDQAQLLEALERLGRGEAAGGPSPERIGEIVERFHAFAGGDASDRVLCRIGEQLLRGHRDLAVGDETTQTGTKVSATASRPRAR